METQGVAHNRFALSNQHIVEQFKANYERRNLSLPKSNFNRTKFKHCWKRVPE